MYRMRIANALRQGLHCKNCITLSLLPSETILAESRMSFYRDKVKYLGV